MISPFPSGSRNGPVGESACRTPIPPPASAIKELTITKGYKGINDTNPLMTQRFGADPYAMVYYRKNWSFPSISFHAAAGAHEFLAHFATPSPEAAFTAP